MENLLRRRRINAYDSVWFFKALRNLSLPWLIRGGGCLGNKGQTIKQTYS